MSSDPNAVVSHNLFPAPDAAARRRKRREDGQRPRPKPFVRRPLAPPGELVSPGEPLLTAPPATETQKVPNVDVSPYASIGRLSFVWRGSDFFGTAWVVGKHGLITAGHNVFDEGEWSGATDFELRYENGAAADTLTVDTLYTLRGWIDSETVQYDLAACTTVEELQAGALPIAANVDPDQGPYTSIGYPAEPTSEFPFDGENQWESTGPFISGNRQFINAGSQLTQGASGGPWWVEIKKQHYVNGLTSQGNDFANDSPYFGQGLVNLYNTVKG